MSIKDLKAKLKAGSMDKISGAVAEKKSFADDRFWKFQPDAKTDVGQATIRFLPEAEGEDLPFVTYFEHSFKNEQNGKWYIEKSRTSLGNGTADPVSESNSQYWETGIESNKNIARQRKRKTAYVSNVLIIKDPANPANEGKTMLFKYGPAIFQMIQQCIKPEFDDEKPFNPFCMWTGADFVLKSYKKAGAGGSAAMRSYDKSKFNQCEIFADDEDKDAKQEALYTSLYPLAPLVAADQFKSYDELKARFLAVIGQTPAPAQTNSYEEETGGEEITSTTKASSSDDDGLDGYLDLVEEN